MSDQELVPVQGIDWQLLAVNWAARLASLSVILLRKHQRLQVSQACHMRLERWFMQMQGVLAQIQIRAVAVKRFEAKRKSFIQSLKHYDSFP